MDHRHLQGKKAEKIASRYLKKQGLKILKKNFFNKAGELDIIARLHNTLCIVEVRSRGESSDYTPEQSVDKRKITHIEKTTRALLSKYQISHVPVRLDLLVIDWKTGDPEIRYYPGGISPYSP